MSTCSSFSRSSALESPHERADLGAERDALDSGPEPVLPVGQSCRLAMLNPNTPLAQPEAPARQTIPQANPRTQSPNEPQPPSRATVRSLRLDAPPAPLRGAQRDTPRQHARRSYSSTRRLCRRSPPANDYSIGSERASRTSARPAPVEAQVCRHARLVPPPVPGERGPYGRRARSGPLEHHRPALAEPPERDRSLAAPATVYRPRSGSQLAVAATRGAIALLARPAPEPPGATTRPREWSPPPHSPLRASTIAGLGAPPVDRGWALEADPNPPLRLRRRELQHRMGTRSTGMSQDAPPGRTLLSVGGEGYQSPGIGRGPPPSAAWAIARCRRAVGALGERPRFAPLTMSQIGAPRRSGDLGASHLAKVPISAPPVGVQAHVSPNGSWATSRRVWYKNRLVPVARGGTEHDARTGRHRNEVERRVSVRGSRSPASTRRTPLARGRPRRAPAEENARRSASAPNPSPSRTRRRARVEEPASTHDRRGSRPAPSGAGLPFHHHVQGDRVAGGDPGWTLRT
jgi:hypothetical protein